MDKKATDLMDTGYELASHLVDYSMDKSYASLMCSNRIDEEKAVDLVRGVYQRAARLEQVMGGSRETH